MSDVVTSRITRRTHTLAKKIAKDQGINLMQVLELAVKELRKELFYQEFNKTNQQLKDDREAAQAESERLETEKLKKLGIKE
ncbi:MAG: hypothetical protein WEB89_05780 [Balneolales bacterium]